MVNVKVNLLTYVLEELARYLNRTEVAARLGLGRVLRRRGPSRFPGHLLEAGVNTTMIGRLNLVKLCSCLTLEKENKNARTMVGTKGTMPVIGEFRKKTI